MKTLLRAFASASLLASSPAVAQLIISGIGHAKDGDSLTVDDREIRLFGIDAPEFDQTCQRQGARWACGAEAANQLSVLVTGKTVRCEQVGIDRYHRMLSRCRVGATDVNRTMVALGLAVAYRRYPSDYVSAEASAKGNRLGLWAGEFENPGDYRHEEDPPAQTRPVSRRAARTASSNNWASRAKANCNIKGNRNRKGQWIYHLPGMPYYDQTRPEEIFCTEAEAQAAGYRRAIVR